MKVKKKKKRIRTKNQNNLLHVETLSGSKRRSSALILLYWSFYANVWLLGKIQWLPQCPAQGRHFMHKWKCPCHSEQRLFPSEPAL